ncbi:Helix-turn-helix domain-containing protein [Izhakiella capsodis]|uniref:Helix-turn-helix domain-containing protein n=1 Tax=Izhakiella capsodis TaxID=1367852 RepID=A0A1I5BSH2_9GAMM|nr:helix-turn-helix domain-containing protein [Izhakiella capsodis]SFN77685.1 Helix-turn-helix domain-containing protein [Izhakiella capsodis]
MSMILMAKAMSITVGNPLRKLVLIKLADNANDKGECWPSYQHIADQCEISKRSVMRHIDDLCEVGLLRKEYRPGPKGNSSNIYHLSLDSDRKSPEVVTQSHHPSDTESPPPSDTESPRTSHSFEPVNEPNDPPKSPKGESKKFDPLKIEIPDWLDRNVWLEWITYRKQSGKPIKTAMTVSKALSLLKECLDGGHDPAEVINASIANGYQGLFKPKNAICKPSPAQQPTPHWNSPEGWKDFL